VDIRALVATPDNLVVGRVVRSTSQASLHGTDVRQPLSQPFDLNVMIAPPLGGLAFLPTRLGLDHVIFTEPTALRISPVVGSAARYAFGPAFVQAGAVHTSGKCIFVFDEGNLGALSGFANPYLL